MVPPDALVARDQVKPVPLPPEALKVIRPPGETLAVAGEIETPGPTATLRVATLPKESVTWTTSVTLPVGPAVYSPVAGTIVAPEASVASDQMKPLPLPPEAPKMRLPLGGTLAVAGEIETPGPTATSRVATLPTESVTCTTSVTLPVGPAVYSPVAGTIVAPDALVASDHEYASPDPPLTPNWTLPRGGTSAEAGAMWSGGWTAMG